MLQILTAESEQYVNTEVRCQNPEGKEIAIMSFEKALSIADKYGLQLVEVTDKAKPPVVRVLDYGKYRYEQKKREKEQKKKQKHVKTKEIKFHIRTDTHDLNTKNNHVIEFLKKGYNVKLTMHYRGREMTQKERGKEIIDNIAQELGEYGYVENEGKYQGNFYFLHILPNKKK